MKKKSIILSAALLICSLGFAQKPFTQLPAKTKSKMAKTEVKSAKKDMEFLQLMEEGKRLFESNDYAGALSQFEQAKDRRPLNVYPPVLIEDVRLALENYVEPEDTASIEDEIVIDTTPAPQVEIPKEKIEAQKERVAEAYEKEMQKVQKDPPPLPKVEEPIAETKLITEPVKKDVEDIVEYTEEDDAIKLAKEYPNGMTEEKFTEGNKQIVRRVVVTDGVATEYRKVTHNWGGVFYFKNAESITLRTWEQETEQ